MTFILTVFMIYAYSILSVDYFRFQFGADYPPNICNTVYSCFLYSLNLGLRNGGGIADSQDIMDIDDPKFNYKLVFDVSFYMLINIISLNIIFGIIIDTFAELRDGQNTRDDDMLNNCFVCGYDRESFEKEGLSFDKHCKFEHNPINYINFLVYLRAKKKDEFDGNEEFVYNQYLKRKTQWAPIGNTKFIKVDAEEDEEAKIAEINGMMESELEQTDDLYNIVTGMTNSFGRVVKKLKKLEKNSSVIKKRTAELNTGTALHSLIVPL